MKTIIEIKTGNQEAELLALLSDLGYSRAEVKQTIYDWPRLMVIENNEISFWSVKREYGQEFDGAEYISFGVAKERFEIEVFRKKIGDLSGSQKKQLLEILEKEVKTTDKPDENELLEILEEMKLQLICYQLKSSGYRTIERVNEIIKKYRGE
tara:strand:+ start:1410 stop:1868 length:459 start_codon:yes stop_codon:yes gene_type:complete